jgi:hypothetical protein
LSVRIRLCGVCVFALAHSGHGADIVRAPFTGLADGIAVVGEVGAAMIAARIGARPGELPACLTNNTEAAFWLLRGKMFGPAMLPGPHWQAYKDTKKENREIPQRL